MKSRAAPPLPVVASSFFGREMDVAAVAERLEESRLVTILGPGGIGKTRLALRVAETRAEAYASESGVWFCDLGDARRIEDVATSVAAALGIKLDTEGALGRAIARRGRILIVLDNFEQLAEHAPATVGRWLQDAPSARFLVTSRLALDLPGEQLWPLAPLSPRDAADLFAARARQVQPSFDFPSERAMVESIVEAIDRFPLGIELAASRTCVLSTAQLRERLSRPLEILAGRRDVGRHTSMRRTVLDSVDLLDPAARAVFVACSALRNGFTLEAAEAVLGDVAKGAVLDHLETLVRTSLVRVTRQPGDVARYALYESIRDVAEELGTAADQARLAERHATYYASVPADARDLENLLHAFPVAVGRATEAHAHEALAIALALEPLLLARGLSRTTVRLLDETLLALDAAHVADSSGRTALYLARGLAHRELGATASALADFEAGHALAIGTREPLASAVALTRLGEMSDLACDTETARVRFDDALAVLRDAPTGAARSLAEAEAYLRLGHARRREGVLATARSAVLRAVETYAALAQDEGLAAALYELAVIEMFAGDHDAAFARFDQGLEVARRGDVRVVSGALQTARGCLLQDLGRLDEALDHHAEAARVFHDAGTRFREASALYYLASTYLERGNPAESMAILRRARERLEGIGAHRYEALVAGCLAGALSATGDRDGAEHEMARAEAAAALVRNEPALASNVQIHRDALGSDRAAAIARAEALVAAHPSDDSRFALRLLRGTQHGPARAALVVAANGAWFQLPGGERSDLPLRSPLRAILAHLAARRVEAPGEVVVIDEIIRVGWPAQKLTSDSALNRAYVALATLRKLGLRGLLVQGGGGYALTQAMVVRREGDAE